MNTEMNLFEMLVARADIASVAGKELNMDILMEEVNEIKALEAKLKEALEKNEEEGGDELWFCNYCKKFEFVEDDIFYNFKMNDQYCLDCGEKNGLITPDSDEEEESISCPCCQKEYIKEGEEHQMFKESNLGYGLFCDDCYTAEQIEQTEREEFLCDECGGYDLKLKNKLCEECATA